MSSSHRCDDVGTCAAGGGLNQTPTVQLGPWRRQCSCQFSGFALIPAELVLRKKDGRARKKEMYAYPTRPIPLGCLCLTAGYVIAHVINVTGAGR